MIIITPRIGLCNQLQTIVKGILLAIKYNRNIYIHKFQIDLNSSRLTDINTILNIPKMNSFLHDVIHTSTQILDNVNIDITNNLANYQLPNVDYANIAYNTYLNNDIELNQHMEIIYVGNIVSLDVYKSFNYIWSNYTEDNLYHYIMTNITFHDKFYELKNYIKQQLHLTAFNSIHLRIEDDAIKYFSSCCNLSVNAYNNKLISEYEHHIQQLSQSRQPIYISSGILDFDNTINVEYYKQLKKLNTLIYDKQHIHIDEYYSNNRELMAIIDLLMTFDSECFVGLRISSFSIVINTHHAYLHKPTTLLNIE